MSAYTTAHILPKITKDELEMVVPFFQKALSERNLSLYWVALRELFESFSSQPQQFFLVVNRLTQFQKENHSIRVLVELGKTNHKIVLPVFDYAIQYASPEVQWAALLEARQLVSLNPRAYAPLLANAMDSNNEHVQWMAALTTLELAQGKTGLLNEGSIQQSLGIMGENIKNLRPALQESRELDISLETKIELLSQQLHSDDADTTWQAILEIAELARHYPTKLIPILESATKQPDPHVCWVSMLTLFSLSKRHPNQLNSLTEMVKGCQPYPNITDIRVLVELGKIDEVSDQVLPLLEQGLISKNQNLRVASMYELAAIGQQKENSVFSIFESLLHDQRLSTIYDGTRVLVELGRKNPKFVINFLKTLSYSQDSILKEAATNELAVLTEFGIKVS